MHKYMYGCMLQVLYRLYIWWGNKFGGSKEYPRKINLGENNLGDKGKHKYFNSEKIKEATY